jgi:predicted nucleic acid-binding protein
MVCYFDSSVILSELLEERADSSLIELWEGSTERFSSNLLKIECIVAIRRVGLAQGFAADAEWPRQRMALLSRYLDAMSFRIVDDSIEEIIRATPDLSDCRTLDAIHLATALYFKPHVDEPIGIVTLDRRMRSLAERLGFAVLPDSSS